MKKFLVLTLSVVVVCLLVQMKPRKAGALLAAGQNVTVFSAVTGQNQRHTIGAGTQTYKTSSTYDVSGEEYKAIWFGGRLSATSYNFNNWSGQIIVECAPKGINAFSTCRDKNGTALSFTNYSGETGAIGRGVYHLDDSVGQIRVKVARFQRGSTTGIPMSVYMRAASVK